MNSISVRTLWLAYGLLMCVLVGTAAGVLTVMGGGTAIAAVIAGAGAFAGATALLILLLTFVWTVLRNPPGQ